MSASRRSTMNAGTRIGCESKGWRPLGATDIDSLMRPCLTMCSLAGFFPYEYRATGYVFSKPRFAFSTGMMLVYAITLLFMFYEVNFTNLLAVRATGAIHDNLYTVLHGVLLIVTYFQTAALFRVHRTLAEVSTLLSPAEFHRIARFVHAKDILGFLFLIVHVPNCFKQEIALTAANMIDLYVIVANFGVDMFYVNCVCILKECFGKMNVCLWHTRNRTADPEAGFGTRIRKDLEPGERNPLPSLVLLLLIKLKQFEEKHLEISDAVQLLNDTFVVRIVILTVSTFVIVTFNLYFHILYSYGNLPGDVDFWYWKFTEPAIFQFAKFSMLIWACQTATNEARKIKCNLYRVFAGVDDPAMKREVEIFSLQIMHRSNTFTTMAFEINAALLSKIIGGVVMYIMILFQFLLNYGICGLQTG